MELICRAKNKCAPPHTLGPFAIVFNNASYRENSRLHDLTADEAEFLFLFLSLLCAALSLCFQLGCLEISAACLKMYFEGNPPANQFLCRAYLCQGQLKSPPATGSVVRTVNWTHPLKGGVCVCVCFCAPEIYTHAITVAAYCTHLH